jgi:antitoxin MazE
MCLALSSRDAEQATMQIYTRDRSIHIGPEEHSMQVSKWGNSLAVRLPAAVVEALDLHEGDDIEIQVEGSRSLSVRKSPDHRELLARLRKYRGRLPKDFRFDRLKAP